MKITGTNYRWNRIIFLFMIIVAAACYSLFWIRDWSFAQNSASLIDLKKDNVSEIKIFNSASSQYTLLTTLNSPKDIEFIYSFVRALNKLEPAESPGRELISSNELYVVISLYDSKKSIELFFHLYKECGKNVYVYFVKKPGRVESPLTVSLGGAKSEMDLYEWLESLNLVSYLGCD